MSSVIKFEGLAWKNFLDVEQADRTKKTYAIWTRLFMRFCEINQPDKLLTLGTTQQIEDRLIAWIGTLKNEGKATASMKTGLAGVLFFYSANRVKLDGKYISRRIPKRPNIAHRSPTKEEVGAIIEAASLRGKALVGVYASSGIRSGALPNMKIRHRRKPKAEELEHHDC